MTRRRWSEMGDTFESDNDDLAMHKCHVDGTVCDLRGTDECSRCLRRGNTDERM